MMGDNRILVALQNELPYSEALKAEGWEVLSAGDAQRAYNVARHSKPAGAVLDARLPRGGAATTIRWMRSSAHTASIPVIALVPTGSAMERELGEAGAQQCLAVEADPQAVCAALRAHVANPPVAAGAPLAAIADGKRLAALRASGLLDTPTEEAYDRLTRLAARLVDAPIAALTLIDRDRQFFKSQVGMADPNERQTPLSQSFCQWVVSGREPVVVENASQHPVLMHNPAVKHMGVSAYAGVPIRSIDGQALGSFCAVDSRSRPWSESQIDTLADLGRIAEVLVARNVLARGSAPALADLKWYATAGSQAILGAVRILRREDLTAADRAILLDEIDNGVRSLMRIRANARGHADTTS